MSSKQFSSGDPAPWFFCRTSSNPKFYLNAAAGRYIVLSFFGSAGNERGAALIGQITGELRAFFDDEKISCFGISIDPADETERKLAPVLPGVRFFWDFGQTVSTLYGAMEPQTVAGERISYAPFTLVLDPFLRVMANIPMKDMAAHARQLRAVLESLPPLNLYASVPMTAPVLVLPRVLEPELCREMIRLYTEHGGKESGYMQERDGKTVGVLNPDFKRRRDFTFETEPEYEGLRKELRARIMRRLLPEIHKAFQFKVTRIERYIVSCYDGETGGFFRAHRDNTTSGTAHRRFACTINLNAEEYVGGDLCFPEFGTHTYRAPTGGAVIFSCSLLHEATPVTKGQRFAFLPFFYNDEAAKIREENLHLIAKKG